MGDSSKIEWTDATWNPVRGCSVVSPGCENCYAMGVAARFSGAGQPYEGLAKFSSVKRLPQWTGKVRLVPEHLADPLRWTKPRRVFVNSMSDLFHEGLSFDDIDRVFAVMLLAPHHTFQVLTKRARRMREYFERHDLYTRVLYEADQLRRERPHLAQVGISDPRTRAASWIWLGVSAENQERANERVPELLRTPAAVRFVSYEPALGPVNFAELDFIRQGTPEHPNDPIIRLDALRGIVLGPDDKLDAKLDWVIVGGESGSRARPFDVAWARSVVEQCRAAGVACFVKQLGAKPHHQGRCYTDGSYSGDVAVVLKSRKGGDVSEWPTDLRVRQFPRGAP